MAFRQPTLAPHQLQNTVRSLRHRHVSVAPHQGAVEDSQEWVFFPPSQAQSSIQTQATFANTIHDFGSLNTIPHLQQNNNNISEALENDGELDSLDDGLHAFREPLIPPSAHRPDQSGESILPAHDGLGAFAASSFPVQEQIWNSERYNPRRHNQGRRLSNQRFWTVEDDHGLDLDRSRLERIEKWRLEQSKMRLEEVEKETGKHGRSYSKERARETGDKFPTGLRAVYDVGENAKEVLLEASESLWKRITRRVIHDLMGIDDALLSIIFGEALPDDGTAVAQPRPLQATPLPPITQKNEMGDRARGWEDRLLRRLARELGIIVHQLSSQPNLNPHAMDYAGIPIAEPSQQHRSTSDLIRRQLVESALFHSTLQDQHITNPTYAAHWGIEEPVDPEEGRVDEIGYWEHTPDLKTVFGYLQRRFLSRRRPITTSAAANIATANTLDTLRRAAIIRQHHPLVSRSLKHTARRNSLLYQRHLSGSMLSAGLKRPVTSCESLKMKRSKTAASESSRHYWDLGESIGSGSGFCGMGGWGEV
jgi:hypothetical protein